MHACKVVLSICIIAYVAADAVEIPIISQEKSIQPDGSYNYNYETGNGIKAEAIGELRYVENDRHVAIAKGSYSYPGEDGNTYSLTYTADEFGYHPVGDHLPQPHAIPAAIQRALDYLASLPPPAQRKA